MTTSTPALYWRQGTRIPHHVYAQHAHKPDRRAWPDGDKPIATFHNPADAALAVIAVNTYLAEHVELP